MKKFISHALIATIAFGGATVALAETSVRTDDRVEVRTGGLPPIPKPPMMRDGERASSTERRVEMNASSTNMMKERDEMEKKRVEMMQQQLSHQLQIMGDRFGATIAREEAIVEKINSRILKIKANGGDTTKAEALVVEAKNNLVLARTSYDNLKITISSTTVSAGATTTPMVAKAQRDALRKAASDVEKYLRDAHKALLKTVGLLRGVSELHPQATTTREGRN